MFFHTGAGLALILVPVVRALSGPTELVIFLNMVGKVGHGIVTIVELETALAFCIIPRLC